MDTRRTFLKNAAGGIAGIIGSQTVPAVLADMKEIKIGQLGLGGHNFALHFTRSDATVKNGIRCIPYAFWMTIRMSPHGSPGEDSSVSVRDRKNSSPNRMSSLSNTEITGEASNSHVLPWKPENPYSSTARSPIQLKARRKSSAWRENTMRRL